MTRLITLVGSLALATTVVTAQTPQTAPPTQSAQAQQEQTAKPDVSLTGCLVQGSGPTVFILENAKQNPENETEKATTYLVVPDTEDLFLRNHLNHQVTIRGGAEDKMAPMREAGAPVNEQDLPKLSAKSVLPVADTCPALR